MVAAAGVATIAAVDYHTAGEPFRIVSGGVPRLRGATVLAKRRFAAERLDHVRRLLVLEPRGHADMYGCFVTEPDDDGAHLGVVFFHTEGYSTACGHGTIALVTWALESGVVAHDGAAPVEVVVDAPSGRLRTSATLEDGRVRSVRFRNVPAFVWEEGLEVSTSYGEVRADISYGGAFYASVDVTELGLAVTTANVGAFITLGRAVKRAIEAVRELVHPLEPELRDLYGVIFFEDVDGGPSLRQRNVTIFADGQVDRSPCGSGTSARLALLDRSGRLERGAELVHESVLGGRFSAWVVGEASAGDLPAVVTEVEGSAHITGLHHFVVDPRDELAAGFLVR